MRKRLDSVSSELSFLIVGQKLKRLLGIFLQSVIFLKFEDFLIIGETGEKSNRGEM